VCGHAAPRAGLQSSLQLSWRSGACHAGQWPHHSALVLSINRSIVQLIAGGSEALAEKATPSELAFFADEVEGDSPRTQKWIRGVWSRPCPFPRFGGIVYRIVPSSL